MSGWQLAPVKHGQADWAAAADLQGTWWPMRALSPRQRQLVIYLAEYLRVHGAAPTARQICQQFGVSSPSTAIHHLQALQDKGWVQRPYGRHAAVRLIAPSEQRVACDALPVVA